MTFTKRLAVVLGIVAILQPLEAAEDDQSEQDSRAMEQVLSGLGATSDDSTQADEEEESIATGEVVETEDSEELIDILIPSIEVTVESTDPIDSTPVEDESNDSPQTISDLLEEGLMNEEADRVLPPDEEDIRPPDPPRTAVIETEKVTAPVLLPAAERNPEANMDVTSTELYQHHKILARLDEQLRLLKGLRETLTVADEVSQYGDAARYVLEGAPLAKVVEEISARRERRERVVVPGTLPQATTRKADEREMTIHVFSADQIVWVSSDRIALKSNLDGSISTLVVGAELKLDESTLRLTSVARSSDEWLLELEVDGKHRNVRVP